MSHSSLIQWKYPVGHGPVGNYLQFEVSPKLLNHQDELEVLANCIGGQIVEDIVRRMPNYNQGETTMHIYVRLINPLEDRTSYFSFKLMTLDGAVNEFLSNKVGVLFSYATYRPERLETIYGRSPGNFDFDEFYEWTYHRAIDMIQFALKYKK